MRNSLTYLTCAPLRERRPVRSHEQVTEFPEIDKVSVATRPSVTSHGNLDCAGACICLASVE